MEISIVLDDCDTIIEFTYPYIPGNNKKHITVDNLHCIYVGLTKYIDGKLINPPDEEVERYFSGVQK